MSDIKDTLSDRGSRYRSFESHAAISQRLKEDMKASKNWHSLSNDQREALEMIAHKVARILNGDANYHDSWHDISGYATLVATRLEAPTT